MLSKKGCTCWKKKVGALTASSLNTSTWKRGSIVRSVINSINWAWLIIYLITVTWKLLTFFFLLQKFRHFCIVYQSQPFWDRPSPTNALTAIKSAAKELVLLNVPLTFTQSIDAVLFQQQILQLLISMGDLLQHGACLHFCLPPATPEPSSLQTPHTLQWMCPLPSRGGPWL